MCASAFKLLWSKGILSFTLFLHSSLYYLHVFCFYRNGSQRKEVNCLFETTVEKKNTDGYQDGMFDAFIPTENNF